RQVVEGGKPFLGICVGMQLMAGRGIEHGTHAGLGWIGGEVVPLAPNDPALKIPHMGWNELSFCRDHPATKNLGNGEHVYFVHGYHMECTNQADVLATTDYGGPVTAMVARDNMIGTQFHPEKSQEAGLEFINGFLRWRP
ncbi:MAG: imidazole glycerol phosphate synthase subunit HisH, partial [Rhodospirillaceae bacterium]|nr:imidazole glycerol phosphate synthase subunit HisH [Rhodospirillaceae bacterium]